MSGRVGAWTAARRLMASSTGEYGSVVTAPPTAHAVTKAAGPATPPRAAHRRGPARTSAAVGRHALGSHQNRGAALGRHHAVELLEVVVGATGGREDLPQQDADPVGVDAVE